MRHIIEFLFRMIVFACAFFFVLEYVFVCEVNNKIGMSILILIIILVLIIFSIFGKKERDICK